MRELEDYTYKIANTIVNTQYQNELLIEKVLDRDDDLKKQGSDIRDKIKQNNLLLDSKLEQCYDFYGNKAAGIKELRGKDVKKLIAENTKGRKKEIAAIKDKFKKDKVYQKKKKELNSQLTGLKRQATQIVINSLVKSIENISYGVVADKYPNVPSSIRAALNTQIYSTFQSEQWEVLKGMRSLRSYRKGMPIPFMLSKNFGFEKLDKYFNFKWLDKLVFGVNLGRDRSNNRDVIEKIMDGTYKLCDSSIQLKGNKIFLLAAVRMPRQQIALDPNITLGIDLGISVPVYYSVNNGLQRGKIGSKEEFNTKRQRIQIQRKNLQRDLQWNKGGKGRKKKLSKLDKLETRERNFVRTTNHTYSHRVIETAKKYNAGTIILEDLKGFSKEDRSSWVLRNWSYFELQTMIKYKANKVGIQVEMLAPHDTSKTCSCCGHTSRENRQTQANFQCTECDFTANADYNAALNISRRVNRDFIKKHKKELDAIRVIYLLLRSCAPKQLKKVA